MSPILANHRLCVQLSLSCYILQVFQLMQPHFRYTLDINANARSTLINADGIVESVQDSAKLPCVH